MAEIRKVDTTNITPLQSLRDEASAGRKEQEIGLEELADAFENEQIKGKYYKRIRRRQEEAGDGESARTWDVTGAARKKVGRYFVVDGGKEG